MQAVWCGFRDRTTRMVRKVIIFAPTLLFVALVGLFASRLNKDPSALPSVLLDTPVASFSLDALPGRDRPLSSAMLQGQVSLLNVFGSWCVACREEHSFLMSLKAQGDVPVHGINWRERNPADGMRWLEKHGDPYDRVGQDPDSRAAIALGVTGAPETFVIDASGVIRYRYAGVLTPEVWASTLKPLIEHLRHVEGPVS
ncbi:DsbE family thiol:disulfide interchange protein [Haematospirillum jordaniae]|nr:DsbE family thiol:disulfide interchange protein [Haematospirillum jordaniae]NKD57683.1 DsbE family thiol:disulfide interchange protein [Haematospirillum jordaniae]NKD59253.1 DsbE family thiol:disulfide interchange protein [Haematospirillum jordaniae]NKD67391.1 DsbE family thiol:disulfide interchange protein [Haematospirillum jordaniae]NKD79468.1 DsbE family thiol:disulfide interchange protein [Haematospirillum jordaniae]